MKEQVKELWQQCFEDSPEFTELYFNLRYKEDINIAWIENEILISALQMLPYPMSFFEKRWNTSYISGACTNPSYRSQGAMRRLLNEAFHSMLHHNIHISTLIPAEPWLFNYYQSVGYASIFGYIIHEVKVDNKVDSDCATVVHLTSFDESVYQYFNRKQLERNLYIEHTADDFKVILADLEIGEGGVFVAFHNKEIVGVAIAYDKEDQVEINEMMADSKEYEANLIAKISKEFGSKKIIQYTQPIDSNSKPLGMARIINLPQVLSDYAQQFPSKEHSFKVVDRQLISNTGYYWLKNGSCIKTDEPGSQHWVEIEIDALCQKLFAPLHPYMNLMLN